MKYIKKRSWLVVVAAVLALPAFGSALEANVVAVPPAPTCVILSRGLYLGARDSSTVGDVTRLQAFLSARGYFNVAATGYFGPVTFNAVKNFQKDQGISVVGLVGPLTRAGIQRVSCGGVVTGVPHIDSVSPDSGTTGRYVTITGTGFTAENTVMFGSGVMMHMQGSKGGTKIPFVVPDTLDPACFYSTPACLVPSLLNVPGNYDVYVINSNGTSNKITFTVLANQTTNPNINSLSPTSGAVKTSVTVFGSGFNSSNTVTFGGSSIGSYSSANGSSLSIVVPEYISPYCAPGLYCAAYVRQVTPGNYDVAITNSNGTSNSASFAVTSNSPSSLSIKSLDAPAVLKVGQNATWTVNASDSSGSSSFGYSVVWGDEVSAPSAMAASSLTANQTTTFTHSYSSAGTYVPKFTVTNNAGATVSTSASVLVTNY